jgi:hypothetical protein
MSILEFIASVIASAAWPASVFGCIWLLRHELKKLFPFIRSLKAPGVEITLDRQVSAVKELADAAIPDAVTQNNSESKGAFDVVYRLLDISPRSALIESWRLLEHAGYCALGGEVNALKPHLRAPASFGEALRQAGKLTSGEMNIIMKLRTLRNQAAHMQEVQIDEETARDYVETAFKLHNVLKSK